MRKTPVRITGAQYQQPLPAGQAVFGMSRRAYDPLLGKDADIILEEDSPRKFGASPNFVKTAQGMPDPTASEGSNVSFFPPLWFSPLLTWVHFYMPRDIKTMASWLRHYDTFQPLVGNAIDLHTQIPLSRFSLKIDRDDPYIRYTYESQMEMLGGLLFLYDLLREYWLLGEAFAYLYWDESVGLFTDVQLLPPDDIIIQGTYAKKQYALNPDSMELPQDEQLQRELLKYAPDLLHAIKERKPIPLDPFFLLVMQRKQSPYMNRGQSIVLRVLKHLIYYDKLLEAQYAIAQRQVTPKEIWKIGNDKYPATAQQIAELRRIVQQAGQSPLFTLFTNHTVSLEYIGAVGKWPDFKSEYDQIEKFVLTGLFTNKAITHGEGPTYANASVAMRALMSRYMQVRSMLENVITHYVFLPVAVAHEFYEITDAQLSHRIRRPFSERKPILPEFDWKAKANLMDTTSMVQVARALKDMGFSHHTVCEVLGIDYELDEYWKKQEEGGVFDPLYEEWRRRMGQNVPAPVGPEKTSSFKLPVKVAERRVSKETAEPVIEEKEFSWVVPGHLTNKIRGWRMMVEPSLKSGKGVPASYIGTIVPSRKGPKLVELKDMSDEILRMLEKEKKNG